MGPILLALFPGWLLWFVPQGPPLVAAVAVALAGLVFYAVVGTVSWRNRFRRSGKVILRDSRATISFWQEHHDLMLVLISSAGTFAATLAAGIILYMLGFVPNR